MPIWDHEIASGGMTANGEVKRATQTCMHRYNACLPLFESIEKHMTLELEHDDYFASHPLVELVQEFSPEAQIYLHTMELGRPMRPFITKSGYIGLGPMTCQPDDVIAIFGGANVPYVLRSCENSGRGYSLVGEAFVYGLMDGEVLDLGRESTVFEVV